MLNLSSSYHDLVNQLGASLLRLQWRCAVAESCTGGELAAAMTALPGSSLWFDSGVVTYSNHAKETLLGVSPQTLTHHGAVSSETVCAMAEGVLRLCSVDVSVAISGIAGPDGGSTQKPVGTVWIAWCVRQGATKSQSFVFNGDRASIREQAVDAALVGLLKIV